MAGRLGVGQVIMPFYLVCDVSRAMTGNIDALSDGVSRLRRAIIKQPVVDDVCQFCILTFSDSAKVVMPLRQMSIESTPQFSVEGGSKLWGGVSPAWPGHSA